MGGMKNSGDLYQQKLSMRIAFWDEMMQHPNYDQFWKERNIFPNLKNIHAAVMTVGGWYDNEDLFGEIGRAHVWNSSHSQISYAVFFLKKKSLFCIFNCSFSFSLRSTSNSINIRCVDLVFV